MCAAFRDLDLPLPRRAVIIGDLNGAAAVFVRLLRGLRLIKKDGTWSGGRTVGWSGGLFCPCLPNVLQNAA